MQCTELSFMIWLDHYKVNRSKPNISSFTGPQTSTSEDKPSDPISVVKSPIADCDTQDSDSSSLSDVEIVVD